MLIFTSSRERRLWFWAFTVFAAIFMTLFIGQPLANQLRDQNVQAVFFLLGMVLVAAAVVVYGLKTKPSRIEISILIGIIAVYIMFFFRLGAPERSHLIEYSVLAIFIHKALNERLSPGNRTIRLALYAFLATSLIGAIDEFVQMILPNRVFDPVDIFFNGMSALMAITSMMILSWVRKRMSKSGNNPLP